MDFISSLGQGRELKSLKETKEFDLEWLIFYSVRDKEHKFNGDFIEVLIHQVSVPSIFFVL